MSSALAFGPGRARPAGIIALSGLMATVAGFPLGLAGLTGYPRHLGMAVTIL